MSKPLEYKDLMNIMIALKEEYWRVMYSNIINDCSIGETLRQHINEANNLIQWVIQELRVNRSTLENYANENYKEKVE